MMSVFTYCHALQGRNVRLLKVLPGSQSSTLAIELVEKSIEEAEFEALSYVWGNVSEKTPIECNRKMLHIGANLYAALHERRRRKSTAFLWADQICINQDDVQEKTNQVRLMRSIYSRANQVIIWLGGQQPEDVDGFSLAKNLYEKCNGALYDADVGAYDFHDFDCVSKGIPDPSFNPTWIALFKIISNPWFGRVWVIQELLVAKRSVMWKGALDMSSDIILWSAMLIGRHRNLYNSYDIFMGSPQSSALMAQNIAASYYQFKKRGPIPLYDMLSRHLGMGATDPRDRFFALAGVCSGLDEAFVDYKKTFREVACLVGKMMLLGFPNYELTVDGNEVLALKQDPKKHRYLVEWLAFHANPKNHELGIPSWVPDVLSPHSPGLLMTGFYNSVYLQEWRKLPTPQVRFNELPRNKGGFSSNHWQMPIPQEIEIKGAIFDSVRILGKDRPRLPSARFDVANFRDMRKVAMEEVSNYETEMVYWLSEIRLLADPSLDTKRSIMDGSSFDSFWRTLVYNRGPRFDYSSPNRQADDSLGVVFGYWYLWKKLQMTRRWKENILTWAFQDRFLKKLAEPFEEAEGRVRDARKFFVSRLGRIGWVPFRTKVGDEVCVLHGMRIPLVVRPRGGRWEVIGACYVHGLMDGELWDLSGLRWMFMGFV